MKASKGFTLVELMIYAGLTALLVGLFGAILITILRVQGQQSASTQIGSELSFMMTTIKRHIREAVSTPTTDANSIQIQKSNGSNVTILYNEGEKGIFIADDSIPATERIHSERIRIDSVIFQRLQDSNHPSSTAIQITITASASTTNPANASVRTVQATASPFLQSQ